MGVYRFKIGGSFGGNFGWNVGHNATCPDGVTLENAARDLDGYWDENVGGVPNRLAFAPSPNVSGGDVVPAPQTTPEKVTGLGVFVIAKPKAGYAQAVGFQLGWDIQPFPNGATWRDFGSLTSDDTGYKIYGYVRAGSLQPQTATGQLWLHPDATFHTTQAADSTTVPLSFAITHPTTFGQLDTLQVQRAWLEVYTAPYAAHEGPVFGASQSGTNNGTSGGHNGVDTTHSCDTGYHWDAASAKCVPNSGQGAPSSTLTVMIHDLIGGYDFLMNNPSQGLASGGGNVGEIQVVADTFTVSVLVPVGQPTLLFPATDLEMFVFGLPGTGYFIVGVDGTEDPGTIQVGERPFVVFRPRARYPKRIGGRPGGDVLAR